MGRGEGTIEEKREGEKKKTMQVGKTEKGGKKRRGGKKKKKMQGVCFEPLPC